MSLTSKTPSQLETMIIQAREVEQAATAALVVNGRSMYAPDEHEQRVKAIETERRQAIDAVTSEVQQRMQAIEMDLLPTDADPLMALKNDDLARASALAPFVQEDIAAGNVAPKLRAVLKSGDRAAQAVWLRYLSVPGERQSTLTSILWGEAAKGYLERTYGGQVIRTGRS